MKETFRTFLYTSVLTIVLLACFLLINSFSNISNKDNKLTVLPITDKNAILATEKIKEFEHFRNPYVTSDTISNIDMIHYIFDNLHDGDYEVRRIQPLKIVCQVTDYVSFVSDNTCRVLVIDNNKLDNYRNLLFRYKKDFEYVDFQYNGYNCVNDNSRYYCLIEDYENEIDYKGYSLVDEIYSDGKRIILYEYYLIYRDEECNKYYSELYCGPDSERPEMDEKTIREYGVYYRHEFIVNGDTVNLEKSFVVND